MIKLLILINVCFFLVGCEKNDQPEDVLSSYIEQFLSKSLSKSEALELLGKELKESVAQMDDSDYSGYLERNSFKKRSFRIILKNCHEDKCHITYILKYRQKTLDTKEYNIDIKKIAQIEKIEDQWKITDIENLKTFIDAKNSIDVQEQ